MTTITPRTARGERTKAKILESARTAFATHGYHEASIVKITEGAGVAMGTFYLYFPGKAELYHEVVVDLNRQLRNAMRQGSDGAANRLEAERGGFRAYFDFLAEHPEVYPLIREAWFVAPDAMRTHYTRIFEGYAEALADAAGRAEISVANPEVAAWALMGVGEVVGMRYLSWDAGHPAAKIPDDVFEAVMDFVTNALQPRGGHA
ncbi:TetR/AcrR family transcriptional regulator [Tessaracoccus sp. MC1865]|uniref:TetR/AcrR family transcriptional regulator n=1 Tax=unclassified Tessaracoccus TaxID=2635419 RepID=UPI0015FF9E7E|nr:MULTISPECIES: TetR/AcrR family transcriptional regulator [unclassified Tessaracoccus]MBB1483168.1 TetR/AcrR family transcriptional regulator [Tessaracoccus sp. MC1865]MBB1510407.1 TetR/AcrR family transcriptional regulator [Tessaracoccus sp. MC1756]QTO37409.1 TetR/AcrR family transcriptional regulator [Tessaracoccus sp. MC1865]